MPTENRNFAIVDIAASLLVHEINCHWDWPKRMYQNHADQKARKRAKRQVKDD